VRVPTTTSTGPVACRPRTARKRSSGPKHSHKNWTYCRGPVILNSKYNYTFNAAGDALVPSG